MKNDVLYYSVGPLLYCPANRAGIVKSITGERFGKHFSLALCLEDTIGDCFVEEAEEILLQSFDELYRNYQQHPFYLPKLFIRVRDDRQLLRLTKALGSRIGILFGFILPKFSPSNAPAYLQAIVRANESTGKKLYFMPILEDISMIDLRRRTEILYGLKDSLSEIEELVLNIRVGGNDLCHAFGFRRHSNESIHRIRPVADLFSDIITVYGTDYVVSGPVWEYYSGPEWKKGLKKELSEDRLCGFIGKTVIHPNQIPVVQEACRVLESDFYDAQQILGWNRKAESFVSSDAGGNRMNEYKTHRNWARQIMFLAEAYGLKK